MADGVLEMRLVVTAEDYDEAVAFYRDVLGLPELAAFDDGHGGGRFTAEGLQALAQWADMTNTIDGWQSEYRNRSGPILADLLAAPATLAIADRKEQVRVMDEYYALAAQQMAPPPWQWSDDLAEAYLKRLGATPLAAIDRYFPSVYLCGDACNALL